MKKLIHLLIFCLLISGCDNNPIANLFKPEIKICDLNEKQSEYANKLVKLRKLTVLQCSGAFSISLVEVTDGKCSIFLFTTKPYLKNEIIDVKARYKVMFNYNGHTISALVTDDFPFQQYIQIFR